ncbi:BspA family leucine-rich repeat surface protein [Glutamicibacter ardleyensis]|uniref:BspA family leucine-rich repeat surface protein n=1 Tax=Glutamicibacter ardleyensis TaxID=225894 RepID=UPI003FD412F3
MKNTLKQRVIRALSNERGETISSLAIGSLASSLITLAVSASMVGMIAVQQKVEDRTESGMGFASVEHSLRDSLTWASDIPSVEARPNRFTTISTGIGTEDDCQATTWNKDRSELTLTRQTYPGYTFHPTTGMPICKGTATLATESVISTSIHPDSTFSFLSSEGETLERDGKIYRDADGDATRIAGIDFGVTSDGTGFSVHQIAQRLTPENSHSIETGFVDGDDRNREAKPGESVTLKTAGVMKTVWELSEAPRGTCHEGERMITLPLHSRGAEKLKVDVHWGDGKRTDETKLSHCYKDTEGTKRVTIIGEVPSYGVVHEGGKWTKVSDSAREGQMRVNKALVNVEEFSEELKTTTLDVAFAGAENLTHVANIPSTVESMNLTFAEASNVEFGTVDTSNVFSLRGAFKDNKAFNRNINGWDTSKVADLHQVFAGAEGYDQPMNLWNTHKVTNVQHAFQGATSFNHSLRSWDASKIERFDSMLEGATDYSESLSNWKPKSAKSWGSFAKGTLLEEEDLPKKFREPVEPTPSPTDSGKP